jgi:hypothetical protein
MPSLFNRSQVNAFGFPTGTNGEVNESQAIVQPQAKPPFRGKPVDFKDDFVSRFTGSSGGYGAITPFAQYLSGQGLNLKSEDGAQFSIAPGGVFNLQNLNSGFSVTAKPAQQSVGVTVPVGSGTVGLEGSWNSFDPSIEAKFAFGGSKQPVGTSPEQAVNSALMPKDDSYTYQAPFNTTPQQNWNITSNPSKEDMAQSMWFAPRTVGYSSQYNPNAMNSEVEALRDKYVQRAQSGGSGSDIDSLIDWLPKR